MRLFAMLILLSALLQFPIPAASVTIHVPGDYEMICEATAVAQYGDTVLVAPGFYEYHREGCVQIADGVVLTSEGGPAETTIWAWQFGPILDHGIIRFAPEVGPQTELSGFTIICADLADVPIPSGIYCPHNSSPQIRNNVIRPEPYLPQTFGEGSYAIYCSTDADASIVGNTIVDAYTAIAARASCPIITLNIMQGSLSGIRCLYGASPSISCNNVWDTPIPYEGDCPPALDDFFDDPLFCDPDVYDYALHCDSPAAHGYDCGLIGALGVGCGPTATVPTTWGLVKSIFDLRGE